VGVLLGMALKLTYLFGWIHMQEYAVMRYIQKQQVSNQIFGIKVKVFLLMISRNYMSVPSV
jgi:hypothetical protein